MARAMRSSPAPGPEPTGGVPTVFPSRDPGVRR